MSAPPGLTVVLFHYPPRTKLALLMPCGPNRDTCTLLTRSDPKGDTGPITFPPIRSIGDTVSGVDHRFKQPLQSMERNQHSAASHQKIRFENRFKSAKTFWVSERGTERGKSFGLSLRFDLQLPPMQQRHVTKRTTTSNKGQKKFTVFLALQKREGHRPGFSLFRLACCY